MPQEEQAHRGDPPLAVFPGSPLVPAPALEAGTLPMALGLALGTLLLVTSLVLGAQWFRGRGACRTGPKRPHRGVCPGPNIPLKGRQGSRVSIPEIGRASCRERV